MKKIHFCLRVALFLLLPFAGHTQWSASASINNLICGLSGEQAIPKVAVCPNGDTYIGYFSNETGNYNVRLQRLDAIGNVMWAAGGILVSDNPQETWLTDWDMTCDPANHAILAFNDIRSGGTNVVVYRISPAGDFAWGPDGIQLSNNTAFNASPKVVSTADGNIVVAWSADDVSKMQKLNPAGALQWGAAGITISSSNTINWPQLLPVGADDVILKYFDDSGMPSAPTRHVYAQRYNASGTAVWATPAVISDAGGISAWTQIFPMVNDGSDGFYITWHDDRDNNQRASAFVQHVSSTGTVLFAANGVEVSGIAGMNHYYPALALPAGSTDVYVFWNEMNSLQSQWGIFGQKVNSAGALQWGAGGMAFIPVSTTNVLPVEARGTPTDMILVYEQFTDAVNSTIRAMRVSPSGAFIWSPAQKDICTVNSQKVHTVVSEFRNNQLITAWEDSRNTDTDIYAQNLQLDGSLGPVLLGNIQGYVTILGEPVDITQTTITSAGYTTHADVMGHYVLHVPEGVYSVTATHPYTTSQIIGNVSVTAGLPTYGIDFTLTVARADMIVSAKDNFGAPLNNVEVVIEGPEGPYAGTILQNTLTFPHVPYGVFSGTATCQGNTSLADTLINAGNHQLQFIFTLTGIDPQQTAGFLQILPNPVTPDTRLIFHPAKTGRRTFSLFDITGRMVATMQKELPAGNFNIPFRELTGNVTLHAGIYTITLTGPDEECMHTSIVVD